MIYLAIAFGLGFAVGLFTCWIILRGAMSELAISFESLGYKLVRGEWTKPGDPNWKLDPHRA
jgi:hypothetical protein